VGRIANSSPLFHTKGHLNMLHKALKLTRQYHEMTQLELANKLGISKSYLSEIESGKKVINIDLLNKYSDCFDVPVSSLVFFSESVENKGVLPKAFKKVIADKMINIMEWVIERGKSSKIET